MRVSCAIRHAHGCLRCRLLSAARTGVSLFTQGCISNISEAKRDQQDRGIIPDKPVISWSIPASLLANFVGYWETARSSGPILLASHIRDSYSVPSGLLQYFLRENACQAKTHSGHCHGRLLRERRPTLFTDKHQY